MRALGQRPIQFAFVIFATAALAVALLLLSSGSTEASHGATTESSYSVSYSVTVGTMAADRAPGADRQLTTVYGIPFPGNINFGNLITFDPADTTTQTCNSGLDSEGRATTHTAGGACLRATDLVGTLSSLTDLATANNSCGAAGALTIDFDLYAVPTPNDPSDPRASTNIAYTQPEGSSGRFGRWSLTPDTNDFINVGGGTLVTYSGTPAVRADASNIMFKGYPEYLLDVFDKDGENNAGKPLVPLAVYGSLTKVAGTPVPLYFVIFSPGALAAEFTAPNPLARATTNLGFASQVVLNDPTPVTGNPSAVTAFCATTSTTILSAKVGGITRATNPDCGSSSIPKGNGSECTGLNLAWSASQRDLDNDGIENSLDTCPADIDVDGDPRPFGNDPDGDNIDTGCDPDSVDADDFDGDSWVNSADNCELISNPAQIESEGSLGGDPGYAAGRADDGGPLGDSIGDKCDSEIGALAVTYNTLAHVITTSDTVSNGRWQVAALVAAVCYGGTDADGDGYCKEDTDGTTDTGTNATIRHDSWTLTDVLFEVLGGPYTLSSAGSWDTDGGNGAGLAFDSDWIETYLGIDARQPCSLSALGLTGSPLLPDEPLGAWIFDYNTDQVVDFGDILPIAPVFGFPANTPLAIRYDWNVDGVVDFGDVLAIAPAFNDTCSPLVLPQ